MTHETIDRFNAKLKSKLSVGDRRPSNAARTTNFAMGVAVNDENLGVCGIEGGVLTAQYCIAYDLMEALPDVFEWGREPVFTVERDDKLQHTLVWLRARWRADEAGAAS